MAKPPAYDLRRCTLAEARALCEAHHGYASAGNAATYCFGVYESARLVAAFIWLPPPPGAARAVCPEAPYAVLALSRMVAVPREERRLRHISKPLRRQMRIEIDRGRWPVLVTYHDEGQGHTGHVYKCAGWHATTRARRPVFETATGARASRYSGGVSGGREALRAAGYTSVQRWEHWACARGSATAHVASQGWVRVPRNRVWASGNAAFQFVKAATVPEASP